MMAYNKKYIITGAPGTGKSTLIAALEEEFPCIGEVSRKVIIKEQESAGSGMPWLDLGRFVELVYAASILELDAKSNALFADRSLLDLIAYLQVSGKSIPLSLDRFEYQDKFHQKVFFAPTWEAIYHKDEQRQQEYSYCMELEKALLEVYQKRGFEIIQIPKVSAAERCAFIKECIGALG